MLELSESDTETRLKSTFHREMIDEMLAEYRTLPAEDDRRCTIIEALSTEVDQRVAPFLLGIAGTKNEFDLARIEALRALPIAYFSDPPSRSAGPLG